MFVRHGRLAGQPCIDLPVRNAEQALEFIQFGLGEGIDMRVRKGPDQQVHFAKSTPPGPEFQLSPACVQICLHRLCI